MANWIPPYSDVQRFLYKSVIHTSMSHPGLQINFLSWFPHTCVDTLPSGISLNVHYLYFLFPEELIATRFVLVSVSFTCHWYYRNVCRPRNPSIGPAYCWPFSAWTSVLSLYPFSLHICRQIIITTIFHSWSTVLIRHPVYISAHLLFLSFFLPSARLI
jgi:hypothetical protein